MIWAHNFWVLDKIDDSLTNSITNMAEHSHQSWAVNWFLKNFSIGFPCRLFFLGGGGGGGGGGLQKVLGKTERTGKFGKISLMI